MADLQQQKQKEPIKYFFSARSLVVSFVFLLFSFVLFVIILNDPNRNAYSEVSPKLIFAENQEVLVKGIYDADFVTARLDQDFLIDSYLKTGDLSFAEVQLDDNVIRLDQNSEILFLENNFEDLQEPRLTFELVSGNVWVNSADMIVMQVPRARASFKRSVGSLSYNSRLNRILSFVGNIDVAVLSEDGKALTKLVLPFKNQVAFADFQIVPDFARLEFSKLKKELKLGPIAPVVLEDEWVKRNSVNDESLYSSEFKIIESVGDYKLRDRFYALREFLTFFPDQKRTERLSRIRIQLQYLLGGVQKNNLLGEADALIGEIDELTLGYHSDVAVNSLFNKHFFAIRNVKTITPAYKLKEYLRNTLLTSDNPELLRTYLSDISFLMTAEEVGQAEKVAQEWLKKWEASGENRFEEFEVQARLFQSLILAHADRVTTGLLNVADSVGDLRLQFTQNAEETIFEIALERLEMSKYLMAGFRYVEAGNYLKTSYANLNLSERDTSRAAREIFIKEAALLGDRIAFAIDSLKGSAEPIVEAEFTDYLAEQERDKSIEERFTSFLEETKTIEEVIPVPTPKEVSDRFSRARIVLLADDIEIDSDQPFEFEIKSARFLDRVEGGEYLIFSALYDFSTDAIYDIVLNEKTLTGNFALADFVRVALATPEPEKVDEPEVIKKLDFTDFLNPSGTDAAELSQIVAQDLAIQLMIKELDEFDVSIASPLQVEVLRPATLDLFRITQVTLNDLERQRRVVISFDYHTGTQMASAISLSDDDVKVTGSVPAPMLVSTVFSAVYGEEEMADATALTIKAFASINLLLKAGDFEFLDPARIQVKFTKARLTDMPIEFSGVYDRNSRRFTSANHELFSGKNLTVDNYLENLTELYVIDYLFKQGILIGSENINSKLPTATVNLKNYILGEKVLNFTFDIASNRLTDISVQGTTVSVDSMTFEEFARLE